MTIDVLIHVSVSVVITDERGLSLFCLYGNGYDSAFEAELSLVYVPAPGSNIYIGCRVYEIENIIFNINDDDIDDGDVTTTIEISDSRHVVIPRRHEADSEARELVLEQLQVAIEDLREYWGDNGFNELSWRDRDHTYFWKNQDV